MLAMSYVITNFSFHNLKLASLALVGDFKLASIYKYSRFQTESGEGRQLVTSLIARN